METHCPYLEAGTGSQPGHRQRDTESNHKANCSYTAIIIKPLIMGVTSSGKSLG